MEALAHAQKNGALSDGIVLYGNLPEGFPRVDVEGGHLIVRLCMAQLSNRLSNKFAQDVVLASNLAPEVKVAFHPPSQPHQPGFVSFSTPVASSDALVVMTRALNEFYTQWAPEPLPLDLPKHDPQAVAKEAQLLSRPIDHLPWHVRSRHPELYRLLEIEGQTYVYEFNYQAVIAVPTTLLRASEEFSELLREAGSLGIDLEIHGEDRRRHVICKALYDSANRDVRAATLIDFVESAVYRLRGNYVSAFPTNSPPEDNLPLPRFSGDYLPTIIRSYFPEIFSLANTSNDPSQPNALISHVDHEAWIVLRGSAQGSEERCRELRQSGLVNGIMSELLRNTDGSLALKFSVMLKESSDMEPVRRLIRFLYSQTDQLQRALGR